MHICICVCVYIYIKNKNIKKYIKYIKNIIYKKMHVYICIPAKISSTYLLLVPDRINSILN